MLVIGLTGGIASGQSTVSALLKSYAIPVIDIEIIARQVLVPGTSTHSKALNQFGPSVLIEGEQDTDGAGRIDRERIRNLMVKDERNSSSHQGAAVLGASQVLDEGESTLCDRRPSPYRDGTVEDLWFHSGSLLVSPLHCSLLMHCNEGPHMTSPAPTNFNSTPPLPQSKPDRGRTPNFCCRYRDRRLGISVGS